MAEQELRQRFVTEGAEEAAKKIEGVAAAQGTVSDANKKTGESTDEQRKKTDKLNVSHAELSRVLNQIHPGLGSMAHAMLTAAELAGKLGNANLSLSGIFSTLTQSVGKFKDGLLLLGAGGAAFLAVQALIDQFQKLIASMEKAFKLMERFEDTDRAIEEKRMAARKQVIDEFAQTKPRATDEDINKATDEAFRLSEKYGIPVERAVKIATKQESFSKAERELRWRTEGFGSGADAAREQIESFQSGRNLIGHVFTKDDGRRDELLATLQQVFKAEGDKADKRINAAQTILAMLERGIEPEVYNVNLPEEQRLLGEETLKALGLPFDQESYRLARRGSRLGTGDQLQDEIEKSLDRAIDQGEAPRGNAIEKLFRLMQMLNPLLGGPGPMAPPEMERQIRESMKERDAADGSLSRVATKLEQVLDRGSRHKISTRAGADAIFARS